MSVPRAGAGDCSLVNDYEKLRASVTEKRSGGGHFGLMLLLREGLAAWVVRRGECVAARAQPLTPVTSQQPARPTGPTTVAASTFTELVSIVANMILPTVPEPNS